MAKILLEQQLNAKRRINLLLTWLTKNWREKSVSIGQRERVRYVTAESFDRLVIGSPIPVLVNFQTPWSKRMVPLLGQLAEAFAGRLRVVNTSADPELAARFKIRAVPTLLLFKKGVPTEFIVGTVPSRFIVETVCKSLGMSSRVTKRRCVRDVDRWSSPGTRASDSTLVQGGVQQCGTDCSFVEGIGHSVQVGLPKPSELLPGDGI
jgi:thioredoxin 1